MPLIGPFTEVVVIPPAESAAMTPEQHAEAAWPWLKAHCAPSTWDRLVGSVATRYPQAKTWSDT